MTSKKKLIEVALPLEAINTACKEDKDRKTGTIRNLHKWFAPMPVPALRALIFASLVDDPGDAERPKLLKIVEQLVASGVEQPPSAIISEAQYLIQQTVGELAPPVFDPFCGGGSTLVEAQRLGLKAYGSDLNPIPVLISRVLTDLLPAAIGEPPLWPEEGALQSDAHGIHGVIADINHYARRVYDGAQNIIGQFYPRAPNGDRVIAWWWARTVESPDPRFQSAYVPLVTNWWLSKKQGEVAYVSPVIDRTERTIRYELHSKGAPAVHKKLECLFSGAPISFEYIRRQGRDGKLGLHLLAFAAHGSHGRRYFAADDNQLKVAASAQPAGIVALPLPEKAIGFRVQGYGMTSWSDLFLPRQQVALETFAQLVSKVASWIEQDGGSPERAQLIAGFLGLCLGKLAQFSSTQCLWKIDSRNGSGKAESAKFGRNDLPMTSDFVETNPFGGSVGDWLVIMETALRALKLVDPSGPRACVRLGDARSSGVNLESRALIVTDPPYYSAIGYANLSDYFYVWLRPALREVFPDLFSTLASPKTGELIAEPARHDANEDAAREYFIRGFTETFIHLRHVSDIRFPMIIIYASKEQESSVGGQLSTAWEAMLEAVVKSGLAIAGTWPIHGTGSTRLRGLGANALATYVAMICRERSAEASPTTRRAFLTELRGELESAVSVMQSTAIAPVDLAQAVIGPGMAVFSRYSKVVEADGSEMSVKTALALINQGLDETLAGQEADFDADTRWAVAWFEENGMSPGQFGIAEALSRAKNTAVNGLVTSGIIEAVAGKVRLLDRDELPGSWDPVNDQRLTVWEATQYLIRALESGGEAKASELLRRLGVLGEAARELAYRLYVICERKKWARDALAYNGLVVAWPTIVAASASPALQVSQEELL